MTIQQIARRLVPFDIEAIRGEDEQKHISWLRAERELEVRDKSLFHNITIYRVTHASVSDSGSKS